VLDGVEDPQNLGAVIRTAHAAGASAVIVPQRRAAGLTETVAKAAAGALEYMPVARVVNVSQALRELKQAGFFVYGIDERGETRFDRVDFSAKCAIVLGAEGEGLHDLVRRNCDLLVRIPVAGKISSLNVSVAAGIALFAWRSNRDQRQ
jgi:23S rRNA (guanosine2251-2'-O)-methyltransferase